MPELKDSPATDSDAATGASGDPRLSMPADAARPSRLPFPVVGVGASAGGLEAYTELVGALTAESGAAWVFVQHLPPDRESLVVEILASHSAVPISQVEDNQPVEPNSVYVIRPGHTLTIKDGKLHLGAELAARGHSRPVDDFFRSLAEEQQQRAIVVVLSGMGSNGTAGAQAVKAVGGLVIAQDPDTAKFATMPRSVIDAHLADFIQRPADIPAVVARYAAHSYARGQESTAPWQDEQVLAEILSVLRTRTRYDFTGYRKPTLLRRVRRRMGLSQTDTPNEYARLVRQNAGEAAALADDLLIHVTGFFRDPEAWEALRQQVIAPLVAERPDGAAVRAWVTACATGEEAYSLAMLIVEAAEAAGKLFDLKVFATDMAERALGQARAGTFPGGIESEVSAARLERFFDRDDAVYRVKRSLREAVVFAPQNVLHDPPFSRLDIATCRNLFIYLEPEAQRRVLAALHFGLRDGGVLMLGTSESIGPAAEQFVPLDKAHRLFRRVGADRPGGATPLPATGPGRNRPLETPPAPLYPTPTSVAQLAARALLDRHTPAAVVVDAHGRVVYLHADTTRYLTLPQGEPTLDLIALAHEHLRGAVRATLHRAVGQEQPVVVKDGRIDTPDGRRRVTVEAAPLDRLRTPPLYLVVFREEPDPLPPPADGPTDERRLVDELQRTRNELQTTVTELQSSNEGLRASHEELQSTNEELQSTNEELETSKEELQSLNEELTTVNAQLQAKMAELEATGNDLSCLLTSTDIAVLFLDPRFRIRRYTPAVSDLLDLIPSDAGRPLADLRRKFADPHLEADAQAVHDRLIPVEREVTSDTGRLYLRRVLPYRTADNRIDGVVMAFVDITQRRRAEEAVRAGEERFRLLVASLRDHALFAINPDGRVATWNEAAERLFGYSDGEVVGQSADRFFTPEERAAGALEHELRTAITTGKASDDTWLVRKDGSRFRASGVLSAVRDAAGRPTGFVKMVRDRTDEWAAEQAVRQADEQLRLALTAARLGVWTWDAATDKHTRDANLNRLLGLPPVETRRPLADFLGHVHPDDRTGLAEAFQQATRDGRTLNAEFRVVWPDGGVRWLRDQGDVADRAGGPFLSGACVDITDLKQVEERLREARDVLEGRVAERTAALVQEAGERRQAEADRQTLLGRLVTVQEEERRRIARDLHDSLGQYLTAMALGISQARSATGSDRHDQLDRLAVLTADMGREAHRMAVELRPTALDDLGLVAAVRSYVGEWASRTGITARFNSRGPEGERYLPAVETAVYRVVQEALTNASKHAAAAQVSVPLDHGATDLTAVIEDDGRGFDPDAPSDLSRPGGLGLVGMRERVALVGGTLQIESSPGAGATVFVRIPLEGSSRE